MNINAAEFKAKCLKLIDEVAASCDGSHYLPWDEFLSKGYDFWASGKSTG